MKRFLSLILSIAVILTAVTACTGKSGTSNQAADKPAASTASKASETSGVVYPIKGAPKLTYWLPLSGDVSRKVKSLNDTMFAKGLIERTGIQVQFTHPAMGQEKETFNLLVASGDMPDIVEYTWLKDYPAGPDAAIKSNLVYKLNDNLSAWAPDFKKLLDSKPELAKKLKTDTGAYYGFPFIRESDYLKVWRGPIVRKDWLDSLGLKLPETVSEWEAMLTAFKNSKGATAPLSCDASGSTDGLSNLINEGLFVGAYGVMPGFYQENGKVVYGPIQPGFKDALVLLRSWYEKGLLDKNITANKTADLDANLGNNKTGATNGNTGGGIGRWVPVLQKTDPKAMLSATKYPTLEKGQRAKFGQKEQDFYESYILACVNPKSKNVEYAVKLLNWGYSEQGYMYYNYGIEGDSYTIKNGKAVMRDDIVKAADNKAEWSYYARSPYNGPNVQAENYLPQLLQMQEQKDAIGLWSQNDRDKYILPPISQTVDESKEFNKIVTGINTYYTEFINKFVTGQVKVEDYDNVFVPEIKKMNISKALEYRQAALDRYNKR